MALNNFDDNQFEQGSDFNDQPSPAPDNKPSGRNFLLAIGILGVILILALVLLLLVAPNILAQQRASQLEQAAQINAANTATAMAATALAQQNAKTATPLPAAVLPTKTPLIVVAVNTPAVVSGAQLSANELATVSALQTQMAARGGGGSTTPEATSTALPTTGFADEVGLPGMVGLAAVLIAVVFLSRKLRTSGH